MDRISITNLLQQIGQEEVIAEITGGLEAEGKYISSKYFYNKKGSLLFEEITRLKEYYPTRTEKGILRQIAPGLMKQYGTHEIIELGPGDHSKVSILLSAASALELPDIRYLPLDISQPALRNSAKELVRLFPNLHVEGYAVDFLSQFGSIQRDRSALICFFGSTIGNFEWETSLQLFTKEFNLNILNSINELIQSDFHTSDFDHLAFFNQKKSRIEMHLVARRDIIVRSPNFHEVLQLDAGESIHTENSHKYTAEHIDAIVNVTGLHLNQTHTDALGWFALAEFQKV
jgi:L-histidine N-alpha-methyltransferase